MDISGIEEAREWLKGIPAQSKPEPPSFKFGMRPAEPPLMMAIPAYIVQSLLTEVERLQSGWASVAERLPDNPKEVEIAFWDGCYMQRVFGGFVDGAWYVGSEMLEEDSLKVTHWKKPMPLPSPPEDTTHEM